MAFENLASLMPGGPGLSLNFNRAGVISTGLIINPYGQENAPDWGYISETNVSLNAFYWYVGSHAAGAASTLTVSLRKILVPVTGLGFPVAAGVGTEIFADSYVTPGAEGAGFYKRRLVTGLSVPIAPGEMVFCVCKLNAGAVVDDLHVFAKFT
jgi:hypothetical protein